MLNRLTTRVKHILKAIKLDIVYYYLRETIYINRVAVTVEKDLSSLIPLKDSLEQAGVKLVAVTPDSIMQDAKKEQSLIFTDEDRRKSAVHYLNEGYQGFAVVREREVCGDIWYTSARNNRKGPIHPDVEWLGIQCGENEAYAFDMYLQPDKRGNNLANLLHNGALHEIKKNGFARVFGYYWAKNIPALWVHRTLRYKELRRIKVTRLFFIYFHIDEVVDKTSGTLFAKRYGFNFTFR